MRKILYYSFFFLFFLSKPSFSQEVGLEHDVLYKNALLLMPQYSLNNGLRFDFERQIGKNPQHRLVISPQFYYKEVLGDELTNFRGIEKGKIIGYGSEIGYKHFFYDKKLEGSAYYSGSLSYLFYKIEDTSLSSVRSISLHKTGVNFIIGYQYKFSETIAADFYTGMGFRYTFDKNSVNMENNFKDFWWNYGYSGTIALVGFKIGFAF